MSKFSGTVIVDRVVLQEKVTATSHGRAIANLWGSVLLVYEAPRWSALERAWLPQEVTCKINLDSLWEERAEALHDKIMRVAREQGCPDGKGAKLVINAGIKIDKPFPSKLDGKPQFDEQGHPVMVSSVKLIDIEIDEAASLALATVDETLEVAATSQIEDEVIVW